MSLLAQEFVLELQEVFNSSLMTLAAIHTLSDEQQVHKCGSSVLSRRCTFSQ